MSLIIYSTWISEERRNLSSIFQGKKIQLWLEKLTQHLLPHNLLEGGNLGKNDWLQWRSDLTWHKYLIYCQSRELWSCEKWGKGGVRGTISERASDAWIASEKGIGETVWKLTQGGCIRREDTWMRSPGWGRGWTSDLCPMSNMLCLLH